MKLAQALAALGLIDEYEFIALPRLAGHGPTLFEGLSRPVDMALVSRLELNSGAVALRYEPKSSHRTVAPACARKRADKALVIRRHTLTMTMTTHGMTLLSWPAIFRPRRK